MNKNNVGRFFKACGILIAVILVSACQGVALLDPQGPIGVQERNLLLISIGLGFIVVIPVIVMTIWFAIRYREKNTKANYQPHWEGSWRIEAFFWIIPLVIIVILAVLTWIYTKELDPYKPIPSVERPVRVQVISLDWNWLFIYPDYDIASVNKLVVPAETPIAFDLTSATVMTSFFIPDLGSQMYVMAGMVSHLNLLADRPGTFTGYNMEFSGVGYAAMHFPAVAMTKDQFAAWTQTAKESKASLSLAAFNDLNKPQSNYPATIYAAVEPNLFGQLVERFMPTRNGVMVHTTDDSNAEAVPTTSDMDMTGDTMNHMASPMPATTTK